MYVPQPLLNGDMTYQYSPLEHSRDLRLVRLGAKPSKTVEPSITCEFFRHSIGNAPPYNTLSYTWASPDLEKEESAVCADGSTPSILPNLSAWIRSYGISLGNQGHLFWIDQLCIDQSNISERGKQVRLMKEIYAKSSKLFVWLGPGSEEGKLALETMNRAGGVLHDLYQDPLHHQVSPEEYYARGFPKPDTVAWGAVYRLFENPYFRRVWVQQEIAASELYKIVLQCGTVSIPWIGLENTAYALVWGKSAMNAKVYDDTATSALQGSQMRLMPSAMSGVAGLLGFRTTNPDSVHRTLYSVLKNFRGYLATDPRDMIFALVGMQYDSQDSVLVPDYSRTVEEIYTLVTYFMITKYGLNILCEAGLANRALDHLPSWVIDWTLRPATNPLIRDSKVSQYRAAASSKPSPSLQNGTKLMLKGLVVDAIDQCTNHPLQANDRYYNVDMAVGAGMFAWHDDAARIAGSLEIGVGSRQPKDTCFWRTLAADSTNLGSPAPSSFGEEYSKVREYLDLLDYCGYDVVKVTTMPKAKELESFSNDSSFLDAWFRAAFQRHFCSTKEGRLGLVPGAALKGDLIVIFLGADVPFVLRPTDGGLYVLIGECYIHGIMNGEALQGKDAQARDMLLQ